MIRQCPIGRYATVEVCGGICEAGKGCDPTCQRSYKKEEAAAKLEVFLYNLDKELNERGEI